MTRSIVAVANAAGSAGKSTTVVSLAALLGQVGRRVLVIDADAQATATEWLGIDNPSHTTGDVLLRKATVAGAAVESATPGVWLVPSTRDLDGELVELTGVVGREQRLKAALRDQSVEGERFDIVLIDCPGSIGVATIAAMVAATAVLTVTQPTMKEMGGISELAAIVEDVRDAYSPDLQLGGIVPCIVPGAGAGQLYQDAMRLLHTSYPDLVTPAVRRTTRVPEAHAQRIPVPVHAPNGAVTRDYQAVLDWLAHRGLI